MSGGKSAVVPPDPMPNSEVKRRSADGSVGITHARVGSRQTFNLVKPSSDAGLFCILGLLYSSGE
jgi:hypothetical protein